MTHDLCIVLRVYPGILDKQKVFCEDKFTLYKKSLRSLLGSLGSVKCFLYVLLDACPEEYLAYTQQFLQSIDHEIISYDTKQGNAKTFLHQITLLEQQQYSNLCLFLEDDYLHAPYALEKFVSMVNDTPDFEFGTSYCSPDYQNMLIHNYRPSIKYYKDSIYATFASTTMTFFCTKSALKKYKRTLLTYTGGNHDFSMWFSMTKLGVYNLANIFRALLFDFFQFKLFAYMWMKCGNAILTLPKTKLYVPLLPGSTHIDKDGIALGASWQEVRDATPL